MHVRRQIPTNSIKGKGSVNSKLVKISRCKKDIKPHKKQTIISRGISSTISPKEGNTYRVSCTKYFGYHGIVTFLQDSLETLLWDIGSSYCFCDLYVGRGPRRHVSSESFFLSLVIWMFNLRVSVGESVGWPYYLLDSSCIYLSLRR